MTEHTKTPWEVDQYDECGFTILTATVDNQRVIAWYTKKAGVSAEDLANAAYIVRCVNSHEALVSACRRFLSADRLNPTEWRLACEQAETALAKAEKEA